MVEICDFIHLKDKYGCSHLLMWNWERNRYEGTDRMKNGRGETYNIYYDKKAKRLYDENNNEDITL